MRSWVEPNLPCVVSAVTYTSLCAERPFLRTIARIHHATSQKALKVYQDFWHNSQYRSLVHCGYTKGINYRI